MHRRVGNPDDEDWIPTGSGCCVEDTIRHKTAVQLEAVGHTRVVCMFRCICVCFLLSRHPLFPPFRFHFILLALRRTTTSLWYVPRARRYTGASSVATLSRASSPFWNGCSLRSYSSPSSTKTIPHLARMACFIIILLITFCHDPATDHRFFRDPYPFREIIKLSRG